VAAWTCTATSPTFCRFGGIVAVDADRSVLDYEILVRLGGQTNTSPLVEISQARIQEMRTTVPIVSSQRKNLRLLLRGASLAALYGFPMFYLAGP
jgi:hypothetical protein